MATIPTWLLGKHVTSVTARWQLADAAGLLGNGTGTTQTVTGLVDEVQYNGQNITETINNLTSVRENEVVIETNDSFVLTEIMRNDVGTNILAALWMNADTADHCLFTMTRGGNSWTFYGVMTDYSESVRKGKSVARMTLQCVDIEATTANPAYA